MTGTSASFALTLVACLGAPATSGEEKHQPFIQRYEWILDQYGSGDVDCPEGGVSQAGQASVRLFREWEATRNALVRVLNTTDSDGTRYSVIRRLMDMRSENAVLPLIKQITFTYPELSLQEPLTGYPAALALARIGLPAVRAILQDHVHLPANQEKLALFAAVVHRHYVVETAVGRFHIQHMLEEAEKELEAEEEPDRYFVTGQKNLARVLEFYDAIDRGELNVGQIRKLRDQRVSPNP